jgi:hypothetical protein
VRDLYVVVNAQQADQAQEAQKSLLKQKKEYEQQIADLKARADAPTQ